MSERATTTRELSLAELLGNTKRRLDREEAEIRIAELDAKRSKGEQRSMALSAIQRRKDRLCLDRIGLAEGYDELKRRGG